MRKKMIELDYFAHPGISNSKLKDYEKSALLFYEKHIAKTTEEPDKDCYRIGRAAHCLALEPDKFNERFIVIPKIDRKSNAGKAEYAAWELKAQQTNADIVTSEEYKMFKKMAERLLSKKIGSLIFECADFEREIYVKCPRTGLELKIKPDISIPPGKVEFLPYGLMSDYKTTFDASIDGFNRVIWNLKYDYQDAFYSDVWCNEYDLNSDTEIPPFIFIPVEKSAPHDCNFIDLEPVDRLITRDNHIRPLLAQIAESIATNNWPGYDEQVKRAIKPKYINR